MKLPTWFRGLPRWAAVLGSLLAALVALTAISMVVGVVFAGIAVGVELGSITLGVVAVLVGLALVGAPVLAAVWLLSGSEGTADVDDGDRDAIETLRHEYASGEIGEETFERRLDALLSGTDRESVPDEDAAESALDRGQPLEEPE